MTKISKIKSLNQEIEELRASIGQRVQVARKSKGLTQQFLAEEIGRSVEAVSNIERGASLPPIDTLLVISKILDVTLNDLIGSNENNHSVKHGATELEINLLVRDMSDKEAITALEIIRALHSQKAK